MLFRDLTFGLLLGICVFCLVMETCSIFGLNVWSREPTTRTNPANILNVFKEPEDIVLFVLFMSGGVK